MRQIKHQYYRNGPDNQKRADITIDMRRVDIKKMKNLTVMERIGLMVFIEDAARSFKVFKQELVKEAKAKRTKSPHP